MRKTILHADNSPDVERENTKVPAALSSGTSVPRKNGTAYHATMFDFVKVLVH